MLLFPIKSQDDPTHKHTSTNLLKTYPCVAILRVWPRGYSSLEKSVEDFGEARVLNAI